ncbi:MAG: VCBS repeat-containing protein, partial [Pseudomonadota bacterium]
ATSLCVHAAPIVEDFTSLERIDTARTSARVDPEAGQARLAPALGVFAPSHTASSVPKTTFSISQSFDSFVVGDINGDLFDDVFFAIRGDDAFALSSEGGELTGELETIPDNFDDQISVRLVDFDGDGDVDIFIGNEETCCTSSRSTFLINDGSPEFPGNNPSRYEVGVLEEGLTVAQFVDLNRDGRPDMVTRTFDFGWTYHLNDGSATPYPESQRRALPFASTNVFFVTFADFNGDGWLDMFQAANSFSFGDQMYLNTRDPSEPFNAGQVPVYESSLGTEMREAIDVDGDGLVDMVGNDRSDNGIIILRNTGQPDVFPTTTEFTSINSSFTYAGSMDINRDGLPDLIARNYSPMRIYLNQGAGTFNVEQFVEILPENGFETSIQEINGDGISDIVLRNNGSTRLELFAGEDGRSPFSAADAPAVFGDPGAFTTSIAVGDVDGDGDDDIVEGSNGLNRVYLAGFAGFDSVFPVTNDEDNTRRVALADLNGDGFLDIVAANDGVNRWYPNDLGDGPFRGATGGIAIGTAEMDSLDLTIVDVNDDGLMDIVFANDGINELYLNAGADAPFGPDSIATPIGSDTARTRTVATADLTGDARPDLIFGGDGVDTWYSHDGGAIGFSADSVQRPLGDVASETADIEVADVNFDGTDDLILAKPTGDCRWFAGRGDDEGAAQTGEGLLFTSDCTNISRFAVHRATPDEIEIVAAGSTPIYFRILEAVGLEAATGFPVSDTVAPLRDVAFVRAQTGVMQVVAANFFSANAVYERSIGGFSGEPGNGLFALAGNRIASQALDNGGEAVATVAINVVADVPTNTSLRLYASNNRTNYVPVTPGRVLAFETEGDTL